MTNFQILRLRNENLSTDLNGWTVQQKTSLKKNISTSHFLLNLLKYCAVLHSPWSFHYRLEKSMHLMLKISCKNACGLSSSYHRCRHRHHHRCLRRFSRCRSCSYHLCVFKTLKSILTMFILHVYTAVKPISIHFFCTY